MNPDTSPEMAVILECCRFAVYGDNVRPLLELLQQPIDWDAANLKATNCPEADKYIRKEYREGWEVA